MLKNYLFKLNTEETEIESILLTFNQDIFLNMNDNDFQLNLNTEELKFDIISHDTENYELFLEEKIPVQNLYLFYNVLDSDNKPIKGQQELIYNFENNQEEIQVSFLKENFKGFKFYNNSIKCSFKTNIKIENLNLTIKKYSLNNFEDFPIDEKELKYDEENSTENTILFNYNFSKDFIFSIELEYLNEELKTFYIHKKPSIYFSSIFHLNSLMENYEINLKLADSFELKLMIWKQSLIALAKAGLVYSSNLDLTPDELALFMDYVSNKILLSKITGFFINRFIPGSSAETDIKSKSLGTYQVSKASDSTDTQKFKHINDMIIKLEEELVKLSNSRAISSFNEKYSYPKRHLLYKKQFLSN